MPPPSSSPSKSSASASAPSGAKVLRVGLVQNNKIIDEKFVPRHENVTVGQDAKNTFIVPASGLPASFPVFEQTKGQYHLVFTDKMEGRVSSTGGGGDQDLNALRGSGAAKKRGAFFILPLNDGSRGKVSLGEITLFFQFVAPPPAPAKMDMPASIRGNLWSGMDRLFITILAASLLLHFAGATFIALSPRPPDDEVELDTIPDRFAAALIPPKPPEPEKKQDEVAKSDEKKEDKKPDKKKDVAAADPVQHKAQLQKSVASKGLLKVLGSNGGAGALADVLGSGNTSGDIAQALNGAAGVSVADANSLAGRHGSASGKTAGIGDLGTSGGGNVNLGNKSDAKVSGRVAEAAPEVDSADVDREALARFVKTRIKAIQGCYESQLKRNPTLKGKVSVRFAITRTGRTGSVEIEENTLGNEAVGSCIRAVIRAWTFPFHPADEVPVSYPFVFSPAS